MSRLSERITIEASPRTCLVVRLGCTTRKYVLAQWPSLNPACHYLYYPLRQPPGPQRLWWTLCFDGESLLLGVLLLRNEDRGQASSGLGQKAST